MISKLLTMGIYYTQELTAHSDNLSYMLSVSKELVGSVFVTFQRALSEQYEEVTLTSKNTKLLANVEVYQNNIIRSLVLLSWKLDGWQWLTNLLLGTCIFMWHTTRSVNQQQNLSFGVFLPNTLNFCAQHPKSPERCERDAENVGAGDRVVISHC